jgi:hypothetical protein
MEVKLALVADAANISQEGKLNLLGVFTNINTRQLPVLHPEMQLVLQLEASPAEAGTKKELKVIMLDEDGQPDGGRVEAEFVVPEPRGPGQRIRVQWILKLNNMTFRKDGSHQIVILLNEQTEAEIPLRITLLTNEMEPQ